MVTVAIVSGSESDRQIADRAANVLREAGIECEIRILSAHRNPVELEKYISETDAEIFIAIA
ncbi:MAG TPA: AIR carboxylase family protein, partial [Candidatus Methanoperedens sp.]